MQSHWPKPKSVARPLRVGFVPLCDGAPLVMAQELGLFEKHGVRVHLRREVGWATVRDKIIYRDLDAAHALAPMVFAASFGLGSIRADCLTGLVLSLEGNAITLAQSLWEDGVRDGVSLRQLVRRRAEPMVFGIPFLYSSHHFLLHTWLGLSGLVPGRDVHFVVVPPPQMPANLKAGHLDGYCVGEPWNSVAVLAGFGWRVAGSGDIARRHPEKVLMVRRDFAEARGEEHERLIAALIEACRFCAAPENRERIIETLGEPQYVNAPASALRAGFDGDRQAGAPPRDAHEPSVGKAAWILDHLRKSGLLPDPSVIGRNTAADNFRADIFQNATRIKTRYEATPVVS